MNGIELAYLEGGRQQDPLVMCLHGFPDSAITFRWLAQELARSGFRVVLPWLRGCPPSEVVDGPYQVAALARDAIALADKLSPGRPAYLVGHDWGGLATYGAAVLAPQRWERAVVLSVPPSKAFRPFLRKDWDQQRASWYQFLFQMEPLAEAVVSEDDFAFIDRLWQSWSPGWDADRETLDAAKRCVREGFPAALNFYRDTYQPPRQDPELAADQQLIMDGPVRVPTLVLHGQQDGCLLPRAFDDAPSYLAGHHVVECLPGVGHFLHLENPELVNKKIVSFLRDGAAETHR